MATRADWLALAARAEAAKGADRALDAAVACARNGFTIHEDSDPTTGIFAFWLGKPWESSCMNCSSWDSPTASLDAALAVVPEGREVRLHARTGRSECTVWEPSGGIGIPRYGDGRAATPARAILAAACRARAEEAGDG